MSLFTDVMTVPFPWAFACGGCICFHKSKQLWHDYKVAPGFHTYLTTLTSCMTLGK